MGGVSRIGPLRLTFSQLQWLHLHVHALHGIHAATLHSESKVLLSVLAWNECRDARRRLLLGPK